MVEGKRMVMEYSEAVRVAVAIVPSSIPGVRSYQCGDFAGARGSPRWERCTMVGIPGDEGAAPVAICQSCWQRMKDHGVRLQDGTLLSAVETWSEDYDEYRLASLGRCELMVDTRGLLYVVAESVADRAFNAGTPGVVAHSSYLIVYDNETVKNMTAGLKPVNRKAFKRG